MGSTHATLPSEAVLTPMHPSKRGWKMGGSNHMEPCPKPREDDATGFGKILG